MSFISSKKMTIFFATRHVKTRHVNSKTKHVESIITITVLVKEEFYGIINC